MPFSSSTCIQLKNYHPYHHYRDEEEKPHIQRNTSSSVSRNIHSFPFAERFGSCFSERSEKSISDEIEYTSPSENYVNVEEQHEYSLPSFHTLNRFLGELGKIPQKYNYFYKAPLNPPKHQELPPLLKICTSVPQMDFNDSNPSNSLVDDDQQQQLHYQSKPDNKTQQRLQPSLSEELEIACALNSIRVSPTNTNKKNDTHIRLSLSNDTQYSAIHSSVSQQPFTRLVSTDSTLLNVEHEILVCSPATVTPLSTTKLPMKSFLSSPEAVYGGHNNLADSSKLISSYSREGLKNEVNSSSSNSKSLISNQSQLNLNEKRRYMEIRLDTEEKSSMNAIPKQQESALPPFSFSSTSPTSSSSSYTSTKLLPTSTPNTSAAICHDHSLKREIGNNRPWSCEICHVGFGRSHDLKRHMLMHTKEKNHACDYCEAKFARKDALLNHIRRRHPELQLEKKREIRDNDNNYKNNNKNYDNYKQTVQSHSVSFV